MNDARAIKTARGWIHSVDIDVNCPHCGEGNSLNVNRIRGTQSHTCYGCNKDFMINWKAIVFVTNKEN